MAEGFADLPVEVPCGQCINCRLNWTGHWATRCEKEAKLHESSCFLTVTYSPENLPTVFSPADGVERSTLLKSHHVAFMKALRNKFGAGIRFFACGEYGESSQRAHFHYLIFGLWPSDAKLWKVSRGKANLYVSKDLNEVWGKGFVTVQHLNWKACAYVAGYVVKKLTGPLAEGAYTQHGIAPPFLLMSRMPGIGSDWYDKYKSEVYPEGTVLVTGTGGAPVKRVAPPYFDAKFRQEDPEGFLRMKSRRRVAALSSPGSENVKNVLLDLRRARSVAPREPV